MTLAMFISLSDTSAVTYLVNRISFGDSWSNSPSISLPPSPFRIDVHDIRSENCVCGLTMWRLFLSENWESDIIKYGVEKIVLSIKMHSLCWKAWERKFCRNSEMARKESEGEIKIRSGIDPIERDSVSKSRSRQAQDRNSNFQFRRFKFLPPVRSNFWSVKRDFEEISCAYGSIRDRIYQRYALRANVPLTLLQLPYWNYSYHVVKKYDRLIYTQYVYTLC